MKFKVLFFGGGKMGELALSVLRSIKNIELIDWNHRGYASLDQAVEDMPEVDIVFSASYPNRIPQSVCQRTTLGAVNIHTSLLPEGRGSHPLNWALIWGKRCTGVTIHKIVDTYDAGDICLQTVVPIFKTDNIVALRTRVEDFTRILIVNFFKEPEEFIANARKQNQAHASYAQKRRPEDSELNPAMMPDDLYNLFRSCDPVEYPAFVMVDGEKRIVKSVSMDGDLIYEN